MPTSPKTVTATTGGAISLSAFASAVGLCCVGPWTVLVFGVSGAVALARWQPLRPYILVVAAALLAWSMWRVYGPRITGRGRVHGSAWMQGMLWLATVVLGLSLFGPMALAPASIVGPQQAKAQSYVVMGADLAALRRDFNAKTGSVRLLFIVGPTCAICLLGMDDINKELLAANTNPRLHTFVIHVPALGAKEKDVAPAMRLITGKNVTHYWEESGIIGHLYKKVLGINSYVWDQWMIYGPDAKWQVKAPPKPYHDVHILSQPKAFAKVVRKILALP